MEKQKYEADWKLYLAASGFVAVILFGWVGAKRIRDHSEGRDVQALMRTANLDSEEHYQKMASLYAANVASRYRLDLKQRQKVVEIFTPVYKTRMKGWIQERLRDGRDMNSPPASFAASEAWKKAQAELQEYLVRIGKASGPPRQ